MDINTPEWDATCQAILDKMGYQPVPKLLAYKYANNPPWRKGQGVTATIQILTGGYGFRMR
jgi:hypothetical protein